MGQFSTVGPSLRYTPETFDEAARVPMEMRKRHDEFDNLVDAMRIGQENAVVGTPYDDVANKAKADMVGKMGSFTDALFKNGVGDARNLSDIRSLKNAYNHNMSADGIIGQGVAYKKAEDDAKSAYLNHATTMSKQEAKLAEQRWLEDQAKLHARDKSRIESGEKGVLFQNPNFAPVSVDDVEEAKSLKDIRGWLSKSSQNANYDPATGVILNTGSASKSDIAQTKLQNEYLTKLYGDPKSKFRQDSEYKGLDWKKRLGNMLTLMDSTASKETQYDEKVQVTGNGAGSGNVKAEDPTSVITTNTEGDEEGLVIPKKIGEHLGFDKDTQMTKASTYYMINNMEKYEQTPAFSTLSPEERAKYTQLKQNAIKMFVDSQTELAPLVKEASEGKGNKFKEFADKKHDELKEDYNYTVSQLKKFGNHLDNGDPHQKELETIKNNIYLSNKEMYDKNPSKFKEIDKLAADQVISGLKAKVDGNPYTNRFIQGAFVGDPSSGMSDSSFKVNEYSLGIGKGNDEITTRFNNFTEKNVGSSGLLPTLKAGNGQMYEIGSDGKLGDALKPDDMPERIADMKVSEIKFYDASASGYGGLRMVLSGKDSKSYSVNLDVNYNGLQQGAKGGIKNADSIVAVQMMNHLLADPGLDDHSKAQIQTIKDNSLMSHIVSDRKVDYDNNVGLTESKAQSNDIKRSVKIDGQSTFIQPENKNLTYSSVQSDDGYHTIAQRDKQGNVKYFTFNDRMNDAKKGRGFSVASEVASTVLMSIGRKMDSSGQNIANEEDVNTDILGVVGSEADKATYKAAVRKYLDAVRKVGMSRDENGNPTVVGTDSAAMDFFNSVKHLTLGSKNKRYAMGIVKI